MTLKDPPDNFVSLLIVNQDEDIALSTFVILALGKHLYYNSYFFNIQHILKDIHTPHYYNTFNYHLLQNF